MVTWIWHIRHRLGLIAALAYLTLGVMMAGGVSASVVVDGQVYRAADLCGEGVADQHCPFCTIAKAADVPPVDAGAVRPAGMFGALAPDRQDDLEFTAPRDVRPAVRAPPVLRV